MKSIAWDEDILAAHRAYLREDAPKAAFDTLVDAAIGLPGYSTEPVWQPPKRSFNYDDAVSSERPFAFIVNQHDLLFYVRLAGHSRVSGGFPELKKQFPSADINPTGEWTVRLASKDDAERLNSFLFSYPLKSEAHEGSIPDGITREDVLAAIQKLDAGVEHGFGPSLKYDLIFEGRRYPPKAVLGLAAERLAGRVLDPSEFTGGESSKSTRILRDLGFDVAPKPGETGPTNAELPEMSNHWWVNHKQTFQQETAGNFLWSPKTNQNGARNRTYENMTLAVPGDVVFSYADGLIKAAGIVTAAASTAPKPDEFGETGENWSKEGWRLTVAFSELESALRPKAHMDRLAALLPETHSPIRASGDGNQGVYLAAIPSAMAAELRLLLTGQVEQIEAKHRPRAHVDEDQDPEVRAEREVFSRTDIGPTQKQTLVNARRGQGLFRERVILLEAKCRVTGVDLVDHLRASHIKPWKDSTDQEKLDGNNGLLLAPHIDHLFDQGYISFTDGGDLLVSPKCAANVLIAWGISPTINVGPFRTMQRAFLAYHRKIRFKS
jgi:putative restriction endonuclease